MNYLWLYGIVPLVSVISGLYLLTGKVVFISQRVIIFFVWLAVFTPIFYLLVTIPEFMPFSYTKTILLLLGGFFLLLAVVFIMTLGKYSVINAKKDTIISMVIMVLDESNISYELKDSSIKLTDYNNREITFWGLGNSVDLGLRDIRKFPHYREIVQNMKAKTKEIEEKVFPAMGLIMSISGAVLLFLIYKSLLG